MCIYIYTYTQKVHTFVFLCLCFIIHLSRNIYFISSSHCFLPLSSLSLLKCPPAGLRTPRSQLNHMLSHCRKRAVTDIREHREQYRFTYVGCTQAVQCVPALIMINEEVCACGHAGGHRGTGWKETSIQGRSFYIFSFSHGYICYIRRFLLSEMFSTFLIHHTCTWFHGTPEPPQSRGGPGLLQKRMK